MSDSEIAEQLIETKGLSLRGPLKWRAFATSSLPVPVSPWIRTETSLSVIRSRSLKIFWIACDLPTILS